MDITPQVEATLRENANRAWLLLVNTMNISGSVSTNDMTCGRTTSTTYDRRRSLPTNRRANIRKTTPMAQRLVPV